MKGWKPMTACCAAGGNSNKGECSPQLTAVLVVLFAMIVIMSALAWFDRISIMSIYGYGVSVLALLFIGLVGFGNRKVPLEAMLKALGWRFVALWATLSVLVFGIFSCLTLPDGSVGGRWSYQGAACLIGHDGEVIESGGFAPAITTRFVFPDDWFLERVKTKGGLVQITCRARQEVSGKVIFERIGKDGKPVRDVLQAVASELEGSQPDGADREIVINRLKEKGLDDIIDLGSVSVAPITRFLTPRQVVPLGEFFC